LNAVNCERQKATSLAVGQKQIAVSVEPPDIAHRRPVPMNGMAGAQRLNRIVVIAKIEAALEINCARFTAR